WTRWGGVSGRAAEASIRAGPSKDRSASKKSSRARARPTAAADGELASMPSTSPWALSVTCSIPRSPGTRRRSRRSPRAGQRRPTRPRSPSSEEGRSPSGEEGWSRFTAQPSEVGAQDGLIGVVATGAVHAREHRRGGARAAQLLHRADRQRVQEHGGEDGGGGAGLGAVAES